MRSDGLTAHDWGVVTDYMEVLKPLEDATKRLEGRGGDFNFGSIAEVISVFEYLLLVLEARLRQFESPI